MHGRAIHVRRRGDAAKLSIRNARRREANEREMDDRVIRTRQSTSVFFHSWNYLKYIYEAYVSCLKKERLNLSITLVPYSSKSVIPKKGMIYIIGIYTLFLLQRYLCADTFCSDSY